MAEKQELPDVPTVYIQSTRRERRISRGDNTTISEVTVDGRTCVGKKIRDSVRARSKLNPEWIATLERGLRQECRLLRQLSHPSIVLAMGLSLDTSVDPARSTLVMEFMEDGNLDEYIANRKGYGKMEEQLQHAVLLDIARGLSYMHSKGIVHYTLCSRKVLLTFQRSDIPVLAKIGGFGAASMECRRPHHMIRDEDISEATMATFAPELFSDFERHNVASVDIFSFGVIMLQVLTQENHLPLPITNDCGCVIPEIERRKESLDLLDDNHPLKQTVVECLSNRPHSRPSSEDILSVIERVELRTMIPVEEVNLLQLAHQQALFRTNSERERLRSEKERLRQHLDQLSEQYEAEIRELEQRVQQLQQQNSHLQLSLSREREHRRQPPERLQSQPEYICQPQETVTFGPTAIESTCREAGWAQDASTVTPAIATCREEISYNITRDEVQILEEIGSGAWATVAKGRYRHCLVAVKWPHDWLLKDYPNIIPRLEREISIMAQLRHPNLVHFIGAVVDYAARQLQPHPLLITELLDTNLRREYTRCQNENISMSKHVLQSIFLDVAYGLHCLHTHTEPIIHRDVSAPNVLLKRISSGCWSAKISDLGSANLAGDAQSLGEGCILYTAPEGFPHAAGPMHSTEPTEQPTQTVKLDIYSYGVLLCEVIAGELPTTNRYPRMLQTVCDKWNAMHSLIEHCTQHSASNRPTAAEVIDELNRIPIPPLRTQVSV